jgi:DNA repair ATPase RecN
VALTRIAAKRADELCRIDASLESLREHLKSAELSLQEAATHCATIFGLEANPGRLEEVENRLEAIARLKRK